MPTHASHDTADERDQAQERYESVLRTVELNTGGPQPVGCREQLILANRHRAGYDPDDVRATLSRAVQNGDLIRWTGAEGRTHYAHPEPESVRESIVQQGLEVTADTVREYIEHHVDVDGDRREIIGAANRLMAALEEDG